MSDNSQSTGGGFMSKINNFAGGGQTGEKKEDGLDKGEHCLSRYDVDDFSTSSRHSAVDYAQNKIGGGDQSNESAVEQAKDEKISDAIRRQYKNTTGSEFPVADKS